jgi:hypothetical protein
VVGRRAALAAEAEERLEGRHRRALPIEPERELVQVGLEVLGAHPVVRPPARCVPRNPGQGTPLRVSISFRPFPVSSARHLRESADAGDPRRLTLRDIARRGWRLTLAHVGCRLPHRPRAVRHGPPLGGRRSQAAWDPALAPAMQEGGRAVLEEQVLEVLLGDLERKP